MANLVETIQWGGNLNQQIQFSPNGPIGSLFDDPGNSSGLSAPAIIRGTVNLQTCSGVTTATGLSTAARQANATAIQNAINYAEANGKFFEVNDGVYEYNNTGIQIPTTGSFVWRGSRGAVFKQFGVNQKGLMVGDWNNALGGYSNNLDIDGLRVAYGTSQATVPFTATTTSGNAGLTGVSSTTGLLVGQVVSGTGIPANATITVISGTTVTISSAATASGTNVVVLASCPNASCLVVGALTRCRMANVDVGADFGGYTATVTFTVTTANGSNQLTSASSTTGLSIGQILLGNGIPTNAVIVVISGSTITISANATATGTGVTIVSVPVTPSLAPAYRAMYFQSGGAGAEFSNEFTNFHVAGAVYRLADMQNLGTGSKFANFYVHNGYFQAAAGLTDLAFSSGPGAQEGIFDQWNFEAITGNTICNFQTMRESQWNSLHFESIVLTGFNPKVIQAGTARFSITGSVFSGQCKTPAASGFGAYIATFSDDTIDLRKIAITAAVAGDYNLNMRLANIQGATDNKPVINGTGIVVDDFIGGGLTSRFEIDNNMLVANYPNMASLDAWSYGQKVSLATHAELDITASMTWYGQINNVEMHVPAALGANITITLSKFRKTGTTIPVPDGAIVNIRRDSGTATNSLIVVDGGSAATLTTNTTSNVELYYQFNAGTGAWVSF